MLCLQLVSAASKWPIKQLLQVWYNRLSFLFYLSDRLTPGFLPVLDFVVEKLLGEYTFIITNRNDGQN